jgi:hypothetical protein
MNYIWTTISDWFKSKGGVAHVVVLVAAFFYAAFKMVPEFHDFVTSTYALLPSWLQQMTVIAIALWTFYKTWVPARSSSSSSTTQSKLGAWMLIAILLPATMMPMTGCTVTLKQISADAVDIGNSALQIGKAIETVYPAVAAKVEVAANDVVSVAQALGSGATTKAALESALYTLYSILAVIPQTAAIAQFIPIVVAAIDILFTHLGQSQTSLKSLRNPYAGVAAINHRPMRSLEGDFHAAWNNAVVEYPGVGMTKF